MESLYFLIPLGLVLLGVAIKLLFWAVQTGQYDDLDMEGQRILFDETPVQTDSPLAPGESQPERASDAR